VLAVLLRAAGRSPAARARGPLAVRGRPAEQDSGSLLIGAGIGLASPARPDPARPAGAVALHTVVPGDWAWHHEFAGRSERPTICRRPTWPLQYPQRRGEPALREAGDATHTSKRTLCGCAAELAAPPRRGDPLRDRLRPLQDRGCCAPGDRLASREGLLRRRSAATDVRRRHPLLSPPTPRAEGRWVGGRRRPCATKPAPGQYVYFGPPPSAAPGMRSKSRPDAAIDVARPERGIADAHDLRRSSPGSSHPLAKKPRR